VVNLKPRYREIFSSSDNGASAVLARPVLVSSLPVAKLGLMEPSIYQFPEIFRRVHMEQPGEIESEVQFLKKVWKRHLARPVRRVLDAACGNSPHGQLLARDGIQVAGVDRSPTMIAAGRAESRGQAGIRFYRRSIENFRIPGPPFDAAFFMSETFPVITDNSNLMSHFKSVARGLRRHGLYCVDIDRHDGIEVVRGRKLWRQRSVWVGRTLVEVREYHRPITSYSGMHSLYELVCTIHSPGRTVTTRDLIPVRYTVPATLELAARASGLFELIACYADLSLTIPLSKCDRRWLAVLRRV
jgi:SAM-dependent methyltransferase